MIKINIAANNQPLYNKYLFLVLITSQFYKFKTI